MNWPAFSQNVQVRVANSIKGNLSLIDKNDDKKKDFRAHDNWFP